MYFILILLLFQSAFNAQLGITIIDETIAVVLFLYYLYRKYIRHSEISKEENRALICIYLFFLLGAISTFVYNYQENIFYGLVSGLFSCKAFLSFFGARLLFAKCKVNRKHLIGFLHFAECSLIISALFLIVHRIYPIFPASGLKFNIIVTKFIFNSSTELMCFSILMLLLTIYIRSLLGLKKAIFKNYIPAIILAINAINYKGLGFYSLLFLVMICLPFVKKFKLRYLLIFVPFVIFVTLDQLEFYSNITSSRGALIFYSFIIAKDHFPLGAGFGTYGTEFSRNVYSPLYSMYGLSNIWGLTMDHPSYITDTMWSGIIGETGYLGLVSILVFFIFIFKYISSQKYLNRRCMAVQYLLIVYGIIECFGDSIFMSARGVTIFVLLAFFISISKKMES